jgi:UTP--glucose-1-phosphate uridylyltransferase
VQETTSEQRRPLKAVIPAAGLGTRLRAITKGAPKELLCLGKKVMLQYVVEEAIASGIKEICVVIRRGKEAIREFLDGHSSHDFESEKAGARRSALAGCEITFVDQPHPRGLGDALLQTRDFVGPDSFVMMIPDQLLRAKVPATLQLLKQWRPGPFIWSSLLRLPKDEVPFFAGARGVEYRETESAEVEIFRLTGEEETRRAHLGLNYEVRGFGRTIYPPEIFEYLTADFANPITGEVDLLKTFERCIERLRIFGVWLDGEPFDLGTIPGYWRYLPRFTG